MDQVADDIVGAPRLASLVGREKAVRQTAQERVQRCRRPGQDSHPLVDVERAASAIRVFHHGGPLYKGAEKAGGPLASWLSVRALPTAAIRPCSHGIEVDRGRGCKFDGAMFPALPISRDRPHAS